MALNAVDFILSTYPWMRDFLGVVTDLVQNQGVTDPDTILAHIRKSPEYARMFPAIRRPDGTLRMQEGAYLQTLDAYRRVLQQHGFDPRAYSTLQLSQFIDNEIDPNELNDRLTLYDEIKRSGREIREAFYVYAGMRLSDDDLYSYVVDPDARSKFDQEYQRRTAAGNLDYETFITRATEAGLDRVVTTLESLQQDGVPVSAALGTVRDVNPEFARVMADVLYTGTQGQGPLGSLSELMHAFELAMIGSAASANGLRLPDPARVEAIRQAGVTRARALEGYSLFSRTRELFSGEVQRLNGGRGRFTQSDFEQAVFLQTADAAQLLEKAQAREASFGRAEGAARFDLRGGRLAQPGLTGRF